MNNNHLPYCVTYFIKIRTDAFYKHPEYVWMNKISLFLNKRIEKVIIDQFKQPILIIGMQMLKINKKGYH